MVTKEKLNLYAEKLMFRMNDEEYDTLLNEFEVIEKQMDLIGKIDGIKDVEPMTFPYKKSDVKYREDVVKDVLTTEEVLSNCKNVQREQNKVPKVVE